MNKKTVNTDDEVGKATGARSRRISDNFLNEIGSHWRVLKKRNDAA